ncbi:hypothetical protein ZWY2020_019701, partial [Hordeum vulgare]
NFKVDVTKHRTLPLPSRLVLNLNKCYLVFVLSMNRVRSLFKESWRPPEGPTSQHSAPYNLRCAFHSEILDATNQGAELLHHLEKYVNNMKWSLQTSLLKHVH